MPTSATSRRSCGGAWAGRTGRRSIRQPVEFVKLNYDFHPDWMEAQMRAVGLPVRRRWPCRISGWPNSSSGCQRNNWRRSIAQLFALGGAYPVSPSVFVQAGAPGAAPARIEHCAGGSTSSVPLSAVWLRRVGAGRRRAIALSEMRCRVVRQEGVWDLKEPVRDSGDATIVHGVRSVVTLGFVDRSTFFGKSAIL